MDRSGASGTNTARQQAGALAMLIVSSALIAATPIFAKLAYSAGASILAVVLGRTAVAAVLLGLAMIVLRRSFRASRRVIRLCVIGGIASGLTSLGLLGSVATIDVGLAMLIAYVHPVIVAVIARMRGTYTFGPVRILYCVVIMLGLALALSVKLTNLDPTGIALAFLGAFALSALLIVSGDAVTEAGPILVSFYTTLFSFGAACLVGIFIGTKALPETPLGWTGFFAAGSSYCLGLALFVAAVKYINVARASLIGLLEPLIAIFLAMVLFDQQLSGLQWLGVAIVLVGLGLLELPPTFVTRMLGRQATTG